MAGKVVKKATFPNGLEHVRLRHVQAGYLNTQTQGSNRNQAHERALQAE